MPSEEDLKTQAENAPSKMLRDFFAPGPLDGPLKGGGEELEFLKLILAELTAIRRLMEQQIGLPDNPETRAITEALRKEGMG